MVPIQEIEKLLATLTPGEIARLLQRITRRLGDSFPGVDSRADICGGDPCIVRTRISIWVLEQARRLGTSEADLLRCYPSLVAEDLATAWAFVRAHRDEIDRQIREHEGA